MQRSGLFNSILVEGEYDKQYEASDFAEYFSTFVGNGTFAGQLNDLKVKPKINPGMAVLVSSGRAYINGYWYENDEDYEIQIPTNSGASDLNIAICLTLNESNREISLTSKQISSQSQPTREDGVYELWLAVVTVRPSTTSIQQTNIMDKRNDTSVCGYVELKINHDITELTTFINEYVARTNADYNVWLNVIQGLIDQLEDLIDSDTAGHLQLQINSLQDEKVGSPTDNWPYDWQGFLVYDEESNRIVRKRLSEILEVVEDYESDFYMLTEASVYGNVAQGEYVFDFSDNRSIDIFWDTGRGIEKSWRAVIANIRMIVDDSIIYEGTGQLSPATSYSPAAYIYPKLTSSGGLHIEYSTGQRSANKVEFQVRWLPARVWKSPYLS